MEEINIKAVKFFSDFHHFDFCDTFFCLNRSIIAVVAVKNSYSVAVEFTCKLFLPNSLNKIQSGLVIVVLLIR